MHLLSGLIAGVAGAENGFVDLVLRGTSVPATYYTDFEGTSSATGTNIPLDARGGAIVFVNELVRVTVKSAGGATIREFVDGVSAPVVEVRSASFNGAAYSGGAIAAGNPTTLQAVLDKWITSAGSVDFKVLVGGAATNLSTAFSTLQGQRRFVITEYGAVGDGVTNCLSAVNAAISAANAAGGGVVYFPPGTFALSSSPTLFSTVSLDGAGPGLTTVKMTVSNSPIIQAAQPIPSRVSGINFTYSGASQETWMGLTGTGSRLLVSDCAFQATAATGSGAIQMTGAGRTVAFDRCSFAAASNTVVSNGMTSGELLFTSCSFTATNAAGGGVAMVRGNGNGSVTKATACSVDCSVVTSGSVQGFLLDGAPSRMSVSGTAITPPATSATWAAFRANSATAVLVESGNELQSTVAAYVAAGTYRAYRIDQALSYSHQTGSRNDLTAYGLLPNTANILCPVEQAGTLVVHTTAASGGTQSLDYAPSSLGVASYAQDGARCSFVVWNDTAGAITYGWNGAGFSMTGTTFSVAANSVRCFALVYSVADAKWFIVADLAGAVMAE